ncbi:fumarate hydratase [Chloroflexota bacterium]
MIKADLIYETALDLLKKSVVEIPEDVYAAYQQAHGKEEGMAREIYDFFFTCREEDAILCEDTSHMIFYITLGTKCQIDPEMDWWGVMSKVTEDASWGIGSRTTSEEARQFLPPRVSDPITLENFGTNCGVNMPALNFNMATGEDCLEITAAPKGGGADMYSAFRSILPADGIMGVKKFVMDTVVQALKGGKTCPPNIIGIGMGGGVAASGRLAHEAGALRPIGSRHPIKWIAELEDELLENINSLGIGPMGKMGNVTAYDVHVEYSWGHKIFIPVMLIPQCFVVRRATARIYPNGKVERRPYPELWFKEARRTIDYYHEHRR